MQTLPRHRSRPPAPPRPGSVRAAALAPHPAVHALLDRVLAPQPGAPDAAPRPGARGAIRRRAAALRRRRRLRHALGSGTLAAGVVASGVYLRSPGGAAPEAATSARIDDARAPDPSTPGTPAPEPTPAPSPAPPLPPPAGPWSHDGSEGVDRAAADPGALFAGGRLHVYATSSTHCWAGVCTPYRVPRFAAPDAATPGRLEGDALPERPPWVAADDDAIWAPAVARVGDGYVLWFAATSGRPGDGGMKCLGAAVSVTPEGPFTPRPEPLHCAPGWWSIDPSPVHEAGTLHLLWRQDDADDATGAIVAAPLQPDGLGLAGGPVTLLEGTDPWEEGHPDRPGIGPVENPAMARHPATGELLLTWSANLWETQDYATGLATCASPLGPCRRTTPGAPWLRTSGTGGFVTTARFGGAGGLSFAAAPDGRLVAVLHAYRDDGRFPETPRTAWAFVVEATGRADVPYVLADAG